MLMCPIAHLARKRLIDTSQSPRQGLQLLLDFELLGLFIVNLLQNTLTLLPQVLDAYSSAHTKHYHS